MNKKTVLTVVSIYIFFYILNYLAPMSFGDDYVYAFVWEGHSMYEPMSEYVQRVSSFRDLFVSQWLHYFTGNGRTVSHTIIQLFLWMGKNVFNFFNAFVSVLLVMEIYWCVNKGEITVDFKLSRLCWIFFSLWAFTPGFAPVFLWLTGACNYLWTAVLLLGFLLPYIRKYYFIEKSIATNDSYSFTMFAFGLISGWTNENSVCWVIMALTVFVFYIRKKQVVESWMFYGLLGLIAGYALLMFAPGNMVRLLSEQKGNNWLNWAGLKEKIAFLFLILAYFHIFPWYFSVRSLYSLLEKAKYNSELAKEVLLTQILCLVSFCMTFMMVFSPNFPSRSAFPGTVLLIIASCILLRIQDEYAYILIKESAKKFLHILAVIYFIITMTATLYGSYYCHKQVQEFLSFIQTSDYAKSNIVVVNSLHPFHNMIGEASWFHLINLKMSENENDWRNVAFARYYGIKGIRMVNNDFEKEDSQ